MAKTGQGLGDEAQNAGLDGIAAMFSGGEGKAADKAGGKVLPPVHLWNPPFCGDIDMRIAADGTWFYQKTPIGRAALVKLFASVLKRENGKYFLVTPVEKVGIVVEDAPFMAVELSVELGGGKTQAPSRQTLRFRTNTDDWVEVGPGHALRFDEDADNGGLKPYVHVRRDLWAKVTRALFYDLVNLGEERDVDGTLMFGVASAGEFFPMTEASALTELI